MDPITQELEQMRIAVTGSTGLVGTRLVKHLRGLGHIVIPVVRPGSQNIAAEAETIKWDPENGHIEQEPFEHIDAVINLAGENIAAGRWTVAKKERITRSRVDGTLLLSRALASLSYKPTCLIAASAIGYYGDRGDEILRESSQPGTGYLADLCKQWEAATQPAEAAGIRTVHCRLGIVLSADGGCMSRLLPLFKSGFGGPVGSGDQYWSWIAIDDLVQIMSYLLTATVQGAVNCVAPGTTTNGQFTKVLADVLKRPAVLPAYAFILKLALGEMAEEMLLSSQKVTPDVLQKNGFTFACPDLRQALMSSLTATQAVARK